MLLVAVLSVVGAVLAGFATNALNAWISPQPGHKGIAIVAGLLTLAIVLAFGQAWLSSPGGGQGGGNRPPSVAEGSAMTGPAAGPTTSVTSTSVPSTSTDPAGGVLAGGAESVPTSGDTGGQGTSTASGHAEVAGGTRLEDLAQIPRDTNDGIDLRFRPVDIDGTSFPTGLAYACQLYCNGTSPQIYQANLGRRFTRFVATAGILDTSSAGPTTFRIEADGHPASQFTVSVGHPRSIDLDVTRSLRLTISITAPGPLKDPILAGADAAAGENGGGLPGAGLGAPRLMP